MSYWPEFYYDVVLGGQYFRVIDDLHRKYGTQTCLEGVDGPWAGA